VGCTGSSTAAIHDDAQGLMYANLTSTRACSQLRVVNKHRVDSDRYGIEMCALRVSPRQRVRAAYPARIASTGANFAIQTRGELDGDKWQTGLAVLDVTGKKISNRSRTITDFNVDSSAPQLRDPSAIDMFIRIGDRADDL
jgi:hypothetical protein